MRNKPLFYFLVFVVMTACNRYKYNDKNTLQPVKARICREWTLTEAYKLSHQVKTKIKLPNGSEEKILFTNHVSPNRLSIKIIRESWEYACVLEENKTELHWRDAPDNYPYFLKITKLTNSELWMEGNPLFRLLDRDTIEEFLELKFKAQ